MSTEALPEVNLDILESNSLLRDISTLEKKQQPLVSVQVSLQNLERAQSILCVLRAANISALITLKRGDVFLEDEEIQEVFHFLHEWDQLTLQNFLEICENWVPQPFIEPLRTESKVELKWFKEWLSAVSDPQIHRYPGLPWRSFVRKVNAENYSFAVQFLELIARPATPENVQAVQEHLSQMLTAKRKVLCIFPKRWNRTN